MTHNNFRVTAVRDAGACWCSRVDVCVGVGVRGGGYVCLTGVGFGGEGRKGTGSSKSTKSITFGAPVAPVVE